MLPVLGDPEDPDSVVDLQSADFSEEFKRMRAAAPPLMV
jgi:hypothetical protein